MAVTIAERIHLFPSRTQKLSSLAPKVLGLIAREDRLLPPFKTRKRTSETKSVSFCFGLRESYALCLGGARGNAASVTVFARNGKNLSSAVAEAPQGLSA